MPRGKRVKPEEIIMKLRQAEIDLAKGLSVEEACRRIEITAPAYYRWRKKYGGLEISQAKQLKDLERENVRLKRLVADLSLDNSMLKEVASGNF
jgi:transposase-like protein